jgi:FMN reductase
LPGRVRLCLRWLLNVLLMDDLVTCGTIAVPLLFTPGLGERTHINGPPMIVGLGGSLSARSASLAALKVALDAATELGAKTVLFDVRTMDLPMFRRGVDAPLIAVELCEATFAASGMVWSSPLYHGTISGAFKNALDWLDLLSDRDPPFLTDKVIGLISTAGGVQALQAVNTMEFVVRALRGMAVPLVAPVTRAYRAFDESGHVADEGIERQLRALGQEVAQLCIGRR